jgi:tetratricopeptide (TPR) repeat protein
MKRWLIMAAAFGLGMVGLVAAALAQERGAAELPAARLQQAFLDAGRAYDDGRMKEAIEGYRRLLDQGYESPALFFNLGNAYFKGGQTGLAVLNYRRAWYETPRDPDAIANLRFALQGTGASGPSSSALARLLLRISRHEWIVLAVAAYWASAAALAVFLLARKGRDWSLRAAALAGLLLLLSLSGIASWWSLRLHPEAVVLSASEQALYAPLEGSTPHFALSEGSIVRVMEQSGDWLKVSAGRQSGWIRHSTCETVLPWQIPADG